MLSAGVNFQLRIEFFTNCKRLQLVPFVQNRDRCISLYQLR